METAKERLQKMTASDAEPALSEDEIDELLLQYRKADAEGNAPGSEEWSPAYDLNAAAAAGWLIKAGRAANTTEADVDAIAVTSRVFDNCMRMSIVYGRKRAATLAL